MDRVSRIQREYILTNGIYKRLDLASTILTDSTDSDSTDSLGSFVTTQYMYTYCIVTN